MIPLLAGSGAPHEGGSVKIRSGARVRCHHWSCCLFACYTWLFFNLFNFYLFVLLSVTFKKQIMYLFIHG